MRIRKKKQPNSDVTQGTVENLIVTDPNGSYTGRPVDPDERPIQDADDL